MEATETTETTQTTEEAGDQTQRTTETKKSAAPASAPKGNDEKSLLLDKISALESDLRKERTTIKTLRTEKETLSGEVNGYKLKDKKTTALNKALSEIGEDFEVTSEKSVELQELVNELQDSEELETKISKLVGIVKSPKQKGGIKVTTPTLPTTQQQNQTNAQSPEQLFELAKTNPDAFRAAVAGR